MPPMPDMSDPDYKLTVFDYSRFFQILYNATYLSPANSEYALSLLTECDFTQGMLSGVPANTVVAHKFGESGTMEKGQMHQLHESGIIYLKDNPLIVTIFTEGREMKMLPGAIASITRVILKELQEKKTAS
jgi:hypothetical protein